MPTPTSTVDHALAAAEQGLLVFPIRPLAKTPLHSGWQDEATTDPTAITQFFVESPQANYGIRTGLENNLIVIDLDGQGALDWWRSTGFHSPAMVNTPSGGGHVYFRIDDTEVPNSQSRLAPKVDVRGEGGYVVGPGSTLPTGTYRGTVAGIADAPAELLAMMPERQVIVREAYTGAQVEAASPSEQRQINAAIAELDALPRVWREGAGWRSTMYRVACWMWRIVNSGAYALNADQALQIILDHTPTDAEWGDAQIMEQWESARKSTAGQYAETPSEELPPLLPILDVMGALPDLTTGGLPFADLVFNEPDIKSPGAIWERRQVIMREALRVGMTEQQAVTLGWNARVSIADMQADPHGIEKAWRELGDLKARMQQDAITPAPAAERPSLERRARVDILTKKERNLLAGEDGHWWGTRYLEWARSSVKAFNAPYHRANLWLPLSMKFAPHGFVPEKGRPLALNLYILVLGDTTSGKSEAKHLSRSVLAACFPKEDSPYIGSDASREALVEALIRRDGKPSVYIRDEAYALFESMKGDGWEAKLESAFLDLYDNEVPTIQRKGAQDISGVGATTWFGLHLSSTFGKMATALTEDKWASGLMPRFIVAVGEPRNRTDDMFTIEDHEGDYVQAYDRMPKQFAAEFDQALQGLKKAGALPLPMRWEDPAKRRHEDFERSVSAMFDGHSLEELLVPSLIRLGKHVRKAATLVAMSEGTPTVTLRHELIALEHAEEWLANLIALAEATSASLFDRQVDDIERFIATQRGGEVRIEAVYRHSKAQKFITDRLIEQLVAEGRATKIQTRDLGFTLSLKREVVAAA